MWCVQSALHLDLQLEERSVVVGHGAVSSAVTWVEFSPLGSE